MVPKKKQRLLFLMICLLSLMTSAKAAAAESDPLEGDLRLVDPGNQCASKRGCGRVEIYHDKEWGTICNDYWDFDDATVVCRQLGFPAALRAFIHKDTSGNKRGRIWMDNVRCEGIESRLVDCVFHPWGSHNCFKNHTEDSAVECQVGARDGDVRLLDQHTSEPHENEGFLQIFQDKHWKYICSANWGITESLIVCRQLGFTAVINVTNPIYNPTTEHICRGTEANVTECNLPEKPPVCNQHKAINVTCSPYIPDSLANALYNPRNFSFTPIDTSSSSVDGKNITLTVIRESFKVCVGAIPAGITCTGNNNSKTDDMENGTTCNRRLGFLCDSKVNSNCRNYEIRVYCPKGNDEEASSLCTDNTNGYEYAPGEMIRNIERNCSACTCTANGTWKCDFNEAYCQRTTPPPMLHDCFRECEYPPLNKTCDFGVWDVEWFVGGNSQFCRECLYPYHTINATYIRNGSNEVLEEKTCPQCLLLDGFSRSAAVVNRKLPGPAVHVCEGDRIIVKVVNRMDKDPQAGVTIHWHGMFQEGTPYMDGTFMVTQCPIPIQEAFIYDFTAYPHGTHWWHSHAGLQSGDGVAGPLIVRQPKEIDPSSQYYDHDLPEHVIFIQDWHHSVAVDTFIPNFYSIHNDSRPSSVLINGRGGQTQLIDSTGTGTGINKTHWCEGVSDPERCKVPRYARFSVTRGKRYRFRMISASVERQCSYRVSIDHHNMTIIATDGAPTKPYAAKSVLIFNAERYDFVLHANQPPGTYWLRLKGFDDRCMYLSGLAIIHYKDSELVIPTSQYESPNVPDVAVDACLTKERNFARPEFIDILNSNSKGEPEWDSADPDETHYIGITHIATDDKDFAVRNLPRINNVTFRLPSRPFLLQYGQPVERLERCNFENDPVLSGKRLIDVCGEGFCSCNLVLNVKLGSIVELVLVNVDSRICHPLHLHGYNFRVVAEEKLGRGNITMEKVRDMNMNGEITKKRISEAIQKDTMVAPTYGYTVVQFKADNPGWWYLHCHFEIHLALGMSLLIHVDSQEGKSHIPPKPESFPECGDWPQPRADDGEAFVWSEEREGGVEGLRGGVYEVANKILVQSEEHLLDLFNRPSGQPYKPYKVDQYRIKTDPLAEYHYFLFKIDTGENWYIHLQIKMSTDETNRDAVLQACLGGMNADSPLDQIQVSDPNNACRRPVKRIISSSADRIIDQFGLLLLSLLCFFLVLF